MLFPELATRKAMEDDWLELTRISLPDIAPRRGWLIEKDHCFQRVLLDNACNAKWTEVIFKKPAYRHAPDHILSAALVLGIAVLNGSENLDVLNDRSLQWRGKQLFSNRA
jgi:hypothetical protein